MTTIIIIICTVLGLCYLILLTLYRIGWRKQPVFELKEDFVPHTFISVIIPARNEAGNIEQCILSIVSGSYPTHLFEIIVIDDYSTDNTIDIVKRFKQSNVRGIRLADYLNDTGNIVAYKKRALNTGIEKSRGELVVTTDADCLAPKNWLTLIAAKFELESPVMIVGPVDFISNNSILHVFQSLDFMSMQGITAAAHRLNLGNMSNGANLSFSKDAFYAVDGYEGISHIASGDDYLLMMKLNKKYPGKIGYLKSQQAVVRTMPQPDWGSFLQQRIRWASKSAKYDDKRLNAILIFAYIFNVNFLFLFIEGLFNPIFWTIALFLYIIKVIADIAFLSRVSVFFKKQHQLIAFLVLQPLHIVYIIIAGLLGFIGVYKWKGRTLK